MKKMLTACSLALSFVVSLSGCAETENNEKTAQISQNETITFQDDLGNDIHVEANPKTAIMIGSFADMYSLAGGKEDIVAAAHDTWTQFDLDLDENTKDIGEIKKPNTELLIASNPDLVIASAKNDAQKDTKTLLDSAEIPAAYFDVSSFEDYLRVLKIFSELTQNEEAYEKYGEDQAEAIEKTIERADGSQPTYLFLRSTSKGVKAVAGTDSVLTAILDDLGAENIVKSEDISLEEVSLEHILLENPDHIFIVYQGETSDKAQENLKQLVNSSEAWKELDAVKEEKVHVMDPKLFNLKPNAQWAQAYQEAADLLYGKE